ncbi:hypothetical protein F5B21DRAFT_447905 [Xylaria acuta]|nr:hypothetical protein F5B21DRAFT_447905 [Xylaria acuta]
MTRLSFWSRPMPNHSRASSRTQSRKRCEGNERKDYSASKFENNLPVDLMSFDYLITKDKLDKQDELEDFLTTVTEFRTQAFSDCNVAELPQDAIVQFERKGFYKLDEAYREEGSRAVFFEIPSRPDNY